MKLSHEKILQLSHRVMAALNDLDEVEIFEDPNTIRQEIFKVLTELLHEEEKIDALARQRITSQKRTIPEGGAEWDILYRKYYSEELRRYGIVARSTARS